MTHTVPAPTSSDPREAAPAASRAVESRNPATGEVWRRFEPATTTEVLRTAVRYPLMPQRVTALIRVHGIWLWLRRRRRRGTGPAPAVHDRSPDA